MLQKSSYQTNITEQRTTYYGIYKYERLSLLCLPFSIGKGKRIAVITPVFRLSVVKQQKNYQRHCCGIIFSERSVFFIFQQCGTEVGTYLLSRAAGIVHYRRRAAKSINFVLIFYRYPTMRKSGFSWLYLTTCVSWSFVLTRCCTLTWVTKILMRAISNVHAGRRFPAPVVKASIFTPRKIINCNLFKRVHCTCAWAKFSRSTVLSKLYIITRSIMLP